MKTLRVLIIFLSIISAAAFKYYLDWRRFYIGERFVEENEFQGLHLNYDVARCIRMDEIVWQHNRVAYFPFIYRGKPVTIQRYVTQAQYTFFDNRTTRFYYHGNINLIL